MERNFDNKYEMTLPLLTEFYFRLFFRQKWVPFIYGICIFSLALNIIGPCISNMTASLHEELSAAVALVLFTFFGVITSVINAKKNEKAVKQENNVEEYIIHLTVTESFNVIGDISGKIVSYAPEEIKEIIRTINLIILLTDTNSALTFKKRAFSVGTYKDFKKYLRDIRKKNKRQKSGQG